MEELFTHKCVTADALAPGTNDEVSLWAATARGECVLVQEGAQAHGASRAVLGSIVTMVYLSTDMTASSKTSAVILFSLEPTRTTTDWGATSSKLAVADLAADPSWLDAALDESATVDSPLLTRMDTELEKQITKLPASASSRPTIVVVDSLNILLELYPLQRVLAWLKTLRRTPSVGSVVMRLNIAAAPQGAAQALAPLATIIVHVETPSSLQAYPILAKERRREIPKRMHGMVLLLRKKKNGRTSESIEYFQVVDGRVRYLSTEEAQAQATGANRSTSSAAPASLPSRPSNQPPTNVTATDSPTSTAKPPPSVTALPVGAEEVSFNLTISAEEQVAKRNVQLPYMHQGRAHVGVSSDTTNLLFIDDDDPDWDDDDLDDDLDI